MRGPETHVLRRRALPIAWTIVASGALAAAALGAACSAGPAPHPFDSSLLGPCEGMLAKEVPASECKARPGSGLTDCPGPTAWALCNGNTFNVCTCDLPSDFFPDGGTVDTGTGPPIPGLVSFDAGLHALPCCTGKVVYELPSSDCPARCASTMSYAVCEDGGYNECTCEIPDGYGFSDFICPGDF